MKACMVLLLIFIIFIHLFSDSSTSHYGNNNDTYFELETYWHGFVALLLELYVSEIFYVVIDVNLLIQLILDQPCL